MRRAFTLIELLVVIAIIAVLVGLSIPAISMAMRQVKTTRCASNLRQVGIAFDAYTQEHADALPPIKVTGSVHWYNLLGPYVARADQNGGTSTKSETVRDSNNVLWGCPAWRGRMYGNQVVSSSPGYGMNSEPNAPTPGHSNFEGSFGPGQRIFRLSAITHASARILIGDGNDWSLHLPTVYPPARTVDQSWRGTGIRHAAGRANYLFYDFHVQMLEAKKADLAMRDPANSGL